MPVLVSAADAPLGRRIALRLLAEGGEVRAYASGDGEVAGLRAGGAFVAVGEADDEGRLEAALAEVHTVVHATEDVLADDPAAIVAAASTLAVAAANAGVRRVIWLSLAGASPDAGDEVRRSLGLAEAALATAGVPSVVLRTSLVDTPELRDALAARPPTTEQRRRSIAPVRSEDLVELVVAFDALRSRASEGHAVFAVDGPETMTIGDYVERVGASDGSMVGRRFPPVGAHPLLASSLDGPWRTDDPAVPDAWRFAGVEPSQVRG